MISQLLLQMLTYPYYEEGSPVQMKLYGPSKCTKLTRPNGRRSNGSPMLRQFRPSKWTTVQWTVYVTSIWTVQMDDGPMDSPCYVNLDGPLERLYYGNLERPKLRLWTVILGHPKLWFWTVILERQKLRFWTVILDHPKLCLGTTIIDCPKLRFGTVILDRQNNFCGPSFWTVKKKYPKDNNDPNKKWPWRRLFLGPLIKKVIYQIKVYCAEPKVSKKD